MVTTRVEGDAQTLQRSGTSHRDPMILAEELRLADAAAMRPICRAGRYGDHDRTSHTAVEIDHLRAYVG